VPKRVDHEERRRQIADALLRTAATRGLHATGMREVAAEAGVSLRLVQYYFGTKEELMLSAMQYLAAQFAERGMARIRRLKETESPVSPRDVIAAILTEALPADDERRTFTVLYTAYFALSLTEPALAIAPLVRNSAAVTGVVAAQLRAAQAAGDTPARLDPDLEAVSLLAMSAGLGTSVLGGQSSPRQAQAVIDYHLHRLFPASRPALRRGAHESTSHWSPGSAGQCPGPKMLITLRLAHRVSRCLAGDRTGESVPGTLGVRCGTYRCGGGPVGRRWADHRAAGAGRRGSAGRTAACAADARAVSRRPAGGRARWPAKSCRLAR
jgi:AcrR family transcriptional regulator